MSIGKFINTLARLGKRKFVNEIKIVYFLKGHTYLILTVNDHRDSKDTAANSGSRVNSEKQNICCIR